MNKKNFLNKLKNKRYSKFLLYGGFLFFFIKGLIWLVVLFVAYTGLNKLF
tara:strand:+ start:427 stop:576 length:150 start_codon:yes stop_codon:yes gene_type:complete